MNNRLFTQKFSRDDMNIVVDAVRNIPGVDEDSISDVASTNHSYLLSCLYNDRKIVVKATKQVSVDDIQKNFINSELLLLRLRESPNFVNVIKLDDKEYHVVNCGDYYICFFAMPYLTCAQEDNNRIPSVVSNWIQKCGKEAVARFFSEQIISAIRDARQIFSDSFVISDIKLSNLLIYPGSDIMYDNRIMISDLGSCHRQDEGLTVGRFIESTPEYRDSSYDNHGDILNPVVDVFAAAVCAYKILTSENDIYGRFFYNFSSNDKLSPEERILKEKWLSGEPVQLPEKSFYCGLNKFITGASMFNSERRAIKTPETALTVLKMRETKSVSEVTDEEATVDADVVKPKMTYRQYKAMKRRKIKKVIAFIVAISLIICLTGFAYTKIEATKKRSDAEAVNVAISASTTTTQSNKKAHTSTTAYNSCNEEDSVAAYDYTTVETPTVTVPTTRTYDKVKNITKTEKPTSTTRSNVNTTQKTDAYTEKITEDNSPYITISDLEFFEGYLKVSNPDDSFCDFENGGIKVTVNEYNIPVKDVFFSVNVYDSSGNRVNNCSSYYGSEDYNLPNATWVIGFDEGFKHGEYRAVLDLFFNNESVLTEFLFKY